MSKTKIMFDEDILKNTEEQKTSYIKRIEALNNRLETLDVMIYLKSPYTTSEDDPVLLSEIQEKTLERNQLINQLRILIQKGKIK